MVISDLSFFQTFLKMISSLLALTGIAMCYASTSVELDVFSGQPNPTWNLSESECAEVQQRINQLPESKSELLLSLPALGYRGLIINYDNQQGASVPIRIYRGIVQTKQLQLLDPGRKLEKWLLSTGQNLLDSNMQRYLHTEITQ
jgi:hypothetical protein